MEMSHASVFPQELMVDILSWLPVKALMRFRCVSKTWKSLISDPTFVKLHLERSSKNTHILLAFAKDMGPEAEKRVIGACAPCSVHGLLENPLSTIHDCLHSFDFVFGSCNGLVCWLDYRGQYGFEEYWVIFWNPATRKMYEYSPCLRLHCSKIGPYFGFGFDDGSDTYKVVVVLLDIKSQIWEVRVHCLGDTCWRQILTCPVFPILQGRSQFASDTINWLALRSSSSDYQWETVTINQLVIFSYDLKNETYRYLLMPDGLFEVPYTEPCLGVLKGCLCLSHDHRRTHVVVWLMREFGVEKSWTHLLNISYEHLLPVHDFPPSMVMPLCMFENEDVLLLTDYGREEFVLYNRRDNRIDRTESFIDFGCSYFCYNYVESLVLPYRN